MIMFYISQHLLLVVHMTTYIVNFPWAQHTPKKVDKAVWKTGLPLCPNFLLGTQLARKCMCGFPVCAQHPTGSGFLPQAHDFILLHEVV